MLLILAGVSISLVVGDNGVLTQSQSAAEKTDAASADSAVQLSISSLNTKFAGTFLVENVNADIRAKIPASELVTELANNGFTVTTGTYTATTDLEKSATNDGVEYTITPTGKTTQYKFYLTAVKDTTGGSNFIAFSATKITAPER